MSDSIQLPELEIEDSPSAAEIENFRAERVNRLAFGKYLDKFKIPGAPSSKSYQWGLDTPEEIARMASEGYKLDNELAAKSPYLTSTENGVNKILDVVCYSTHIAFKQASDEAFEISKQLKLDPRKSYSDAAKEVGKALGEDFRDLPEQEIKKNESRVLSGAETRFELLKDKKTS